VSNTPITDRAKYWHTAEGGEVVNPDDMAELELMCEELATQLEECYEERYAVPVRQLLTKWETMKKGGV